MDEAETLCDRVAIVDQGRVIALGTPRELIASLGAEHVVEFAVDRRRRASAPVALAALPGVRDVRGGRAAIRLRVSRAARRDPGAARRAASARARACRSSPRTRRRSRTCSSPTPDGICAMSRRERPSHPLVELTLARLREFVREPEAVFWVVVFPLVLAFALGIAFRAKADEPVYAGVVDGRGRGRDRRRRSRQRRASPCACVPGDRADVALRDGEVQVIVLPGSPPTYRYDATRPESRLARLAVDAALQRAAGRADVFTAGQQRLEVIGARYIDWLVPGLLGMNIMGTGMWSIGFSVVFARTRQAAEAPGRDADGPARLPAGADARAARVPRGRGGRAAGVRARWSFSVPMRGLAGHAARSSCWSARSAFGGLGLLVASRARTIEAASGLDELRDAADVGACRACSSRPRTFPAAMQPFIHALPLTALNDALRAVMLDGASAAAIGHELAILGAWAVGCFAVALKVFRWK